MASDAVVALADAQVDTLADSTPAVDDAQADGRPNEAGSAPSAGKGTSARLPRTARPRALSGAATVAETTAVDRAGKEPPPVDPLLLQQIQHRLQQLDGRLARANASLETLRAEISQIPTTADARLTAAQRKLEQLRRELRETEAAVDTEQRAIESLKFQTSSGQ